MAATKALAFPETLMRNGKSFDSFICKDSAGVGGRKGAALLPQQSRNESAPKVLLGVVPNPFHQHGAPLTPGF